MDPVFQSTVTTSSICRHEKESKEKPTSEERESMNMAKGNMWKRL
jgi:hypothetical protein